MRVKIVTRFWIAGVMLCDFNRSNTKTTIMKKIVVLGGGESGCGAAVLAQQKGFKVFLSDKGR